MTLELTDDELRMYRTTRGPERIVCPDRTGSTGSGLRITVAAAVGFTLLALPGCVPFELPEPPDLAPLNRSYEQPTATLDEDNAESLIARFSERRARLQTVDELRDVRRMAADFDASVAASKDEDGMSTGVEIDGIPIETDAVVTVRASCSEVVETTGSPPDDIVARAVLERSQIRPVLWGGAEDCAVTPSDVVGLETTFSGDVAVFLPTLLQEDVTPIYLIDYAIRRLGTSGFEETDLTGHLRFVGAVAELLLAEPDTGDTALLFAGPEPAVVGVRAANGLWFCLPEERRCEHQSSPDAFSY